MSTEDLRQVQAIELEMLLEVDRICRKNDIKYCIIAGTLLGAVRHGGFIPWDDDADVAMLRTEYEKFSEACKKDLDQNRFYFQSHENTKDYRWGYAKIRRKGTEFVRKGQEHLIYPTGFFIDIFPLDNVPDQYLLRIFHNIICTFIRKTLWSPVGAKEDHRVIMRIIYRILSFLPKEFIFITYDKFKRICNKKKTKYVRILTFPTPPNGVYGYFRKWYETLGELVFEGHKFLAPEDYDEYLAFKFGDYKKLPPPSQRHGHEFIRYKLLNK